jgi:hypothetical protein
MMIYRWGKMAFTEFRYRSTDFLLRKKIMFLVLSFLSITICFLLASSAIAVEPFCPGGSQSDPNVIWCDDFDDSVSPARKYWIYNNGGGAGSFNLVNGVGLNGSAGMQVVWQPGQVEAGNIKMLFGRNPFASGIYTDVDFKEIYWRLFVKMKQGWTGNPYKFSRATIMANSNWAQAMVAHLWDGSLNTLGTDPVSGIDANGNLATTVYNDFDNFRWLGHKAGVTPIFSSAASGQWYCVEAHVKLNTPGFSDGVFEFWVGGNQEASSNSLNWVGTWQHYGINAIFVENYWDGGAPGERTRYFDNFVISKKRIGCNPAGSVDLTPPAVTLTNPSNNQAAVPVNTSVSATFSEPVDPLTVTTTTFLVRQGSTSIPGTVKLNGTTATFTPSAPLTSNTGYTATITVGVKDIAGNAMAADSTWSFTTKDAPDTTPPMVSSTIPSNGTAGISISTPITVVFNEAMDSSSFGSSAFNLTGGGVSVSCTIDASGSQATITPAANLAYKTTYTATVTTSVKDAAGNPLANNYAWTFTTEQNQQLPPPLSGEGGGGGGCTVSTERKSNAESPFGKMLGLFSPGILLLLRKAISMRQTRLQARG